MVNSGEALEVLISSPLNCECSNVHHHLIISFDEHRRANWNTMGNQYRRSVFRLVQWWKTISMLDWARSQILIIVVQTLESARRTVRRSNTTFDLLRAFAAVARIMETSAPVSMRNSALVFLSVMLIRRVTASERSAASDHSAISFPSDICVTVRHFFASSPRAWWYQQYTRPDARAGPGDRGCCAADNGVRAEARNDGIRRRPRVFPRFGRSFSIFASRLVIWPKWLVILALAASMRDICAFNVPAVAMSWISSAVSAKTSSGSVLPTTADCITDRSCCFERFLHHLPLREIAHSA